MNMGKLKNLYQLCKQVFGPLILILGGGFTVFSEWAGVLFPDGAFPFLEKNGFRIGITVFIVAGIYLILRTESKLRELDELLSNKHMRGLWVDGIPPTLDEYIRYVQQGDFGVVNRFWQAGISNVTDSRGRSDLHVSCEAGHAAIVQGILERGGNPKGHDGSGLTPLMLSAIEGRAQVIDVLLQHDCAVNAKSSNDGCSALFIASAYGHDRAIEALLNQGAEVDARDHNNLTPLMASVARKNWNTATLLLGAGIRCARRSSCPRPPRPRQGGNPACAGRGIRGLRAGSKNCRIAPFQREG